MPACGLVGLSCSCSTPPDRLWWLGSSGASSRLPGSLHAAIEEQPRSRCIPAHAKPSGQGVAIPRFRPVHPRPRGGETPQDPRPVFLVVSNRCRTCAVVHAHAGVTRVLLSWRSRSTLHPVVLRGKRLFARSYRTRSSCSALPMTDPGLCPYSPMSFGCTTQMSLTGIDEFHGDRSRMQSPVAVVRQ